MMKEELATLTQLYALIIDFFVNYSFQVIGAIIILIIGLIVAPLDWQTDAQSLPASSC